MPRTHDDDWDDFEHTDEGDEEDGSPTYPCPECRQEVYTDAEQCPACGHYLTDEDHRPEQKVGWVKATALICLFAFLFSLLVGLLRFL